jgi:hypothetical protein
MIRITVGAITAGPNESTDTATWLVVTQGGEDSCLDHMRARVRLDQWRPYRAGYWPR